MKNEIDASELMLAPDGSIYHLQLFPEDIAPNLIFVGDPTRVPEVSKHFDSIRLKKSNREFVTHTGEIAGQPITVLSTGMGEGAIDIAMNELDVLANVDLKTRKIHPTLSSYNILRLGTCGGLCGELPLDSLVVSDYAIGIGNAMRFYDYDAQGVEDEIKSSFKEAVAKRLDNINFHVTQAGPLAEQFGSIAAPGITLTASGFFGAQNRELRVPLRFKDFFETVIDYRFQQYQILNFEMETAAIYRLSKIFGYNACSISMVVDNRIKKKVSKNPAAAIDNMIQQSLEVYVSYIKG